jgi:hypothetical protein
MCVSVWVIHTCVLVYVSLLVIYFLYSECNSSYTIYNIDFIIIFAVIRSLNKKKGTCFLFLDA